MNPSEENLYRVDEEYRDTIATVDATGKRVWVYPKKPSGRYHRWRIAVTTALLLLLFSGPFIRYDGRPFMLFNFLDRKFILFGHIFWPQDFFLLALLLLAFFLFVILFTVAFGRIWCGWMCPQTLFMEMVFRKIEYWIEGDANAQYRLDAAPWTASKIGKKAAKHLIFFAIALLIAHLVMAYIIGVDSVRDVVSHAPAEHPGGFISLMAFTFVFYGVFAYLREQACVAICPYGRLQGVLLNKDSIVVAYDHVRGEPRGKIRKNDPDTRALRGDCIDCKLCVRVCPTGIDIREGTQLECVNCTACIDACDGVMEKINKPTGLIRYSSFTAISKQAHKILTPRTIAYGALLTVLVGLLSYLVATRSDIEATVLKMPGALYSRTEDGKISNVYHIEFVNKTFHDMAIRIKPEAPSTASLVAVGGDPVVEVPKEGILKRIFIVKMSEEDLKQTKTTVLLGLYDGDKKIETVKARFIGPISLSVPSP